MSKKEYKNLLIRLEPALYAAFAQLAENDRRSNSNLAEVVIAHYVKTHPLPQAAEITESHTQSIFVNDPSISPPIVNSELKAKAPRTKNKKVS